MFIDRQRFFFAACNRHRETGGKNHLIGLFLDAGCNNFLEGGTNG
jgi:hypothetical protein